MSKAQAPTRFRARFFRIWAMTERCLASTSTRAADVTASCVFRARNSVLAVRANVRAAFFPPGTDREHSLTLTPVAYTSRSRSAWAVTRLHDRHFPTNLGHEIPAESAGRHT